MNSIITEDIIKKALDESINEFMLEEGAWDSLKNSTLGKVGKGIWNGVKMYMDARTNGQWNNKYGQYVNSNNKFGEMFYLNKWFNYHLKQIKGIDYYERNPNAEAKKERQFTYDSSGNKVYTDIESRYGSTETYVQENCTSINFNTWINKFIKDRESLQCIDDYIDNNVNKATDLQSAVKWMNLNTFYNSKEGKEYLKHKNSELQKSPNQQVNYIEYCKNAIENIDNATIDFFKNAERAAFSPGGIDAQLKKSFATQYATKNKFILNAVECVSKYAKSIVDNTKSNYSYLRMNLTYQAFKADASGATYEKIVNATKKAFAMQAGRHALQQKQQTA